MATAAGVTGLILDQMSDGRIYTPRMVAANTGHESKRTASMMYYLGQRGTLVRVSPGLYRLPPTSS